jgi:hypothetical protein
MDEGDEPIKGAGFTVNGGNHLARTGADGIAYLPRLPAYQNVDLALDPNTLEDPQWQPQVKGVRIVPRPGKVNDVELAVSITGEIDGTTYFLAKGKSRPIGDLHLELVDATRKVVATIGSASDGYYVMTGVFPGNYMLRVAPDQLKRLGLTDSGMHLITIGPDGTVLNGRDFYARPADEDRQPEPPAPAEPPPPKPQAGEIGGTAYLLSKGKSRPIGDLHLELMDATHKVVASIGSAPDGRYVITGVLPGDYLLRVAPGQLKQLGLLDPGMHMITIGPDGMVRKGRDFHVQPADEG